MMTSLRNLCLLSLSLALAFTACRPDQPRIDGEPPEAVPSVGEEVVAATPEDRALLLRHAADAEEMVVRMHEHIRFMHQLAPPMVPAHLEEHARQLSELVTLIERQVAEQGGELDDARAEAMMGIRPDRYRVLHEDMEIAQAEVQHLQAASEEEIRERLPGHLDRLSRIVETLESASAHMRRVGGA